MSDSSKCPHDDTFVEPTIRRLETCNKCGELLTDYAYFHKAAERGDAVAQDVLGDMYEGNWGGVGGQNLERALHWYLKAHGSEDIIPGYCSDFLEELHGVDKQFAEEVGKVMLVARDGNPNAKWELGAMYFNGKGVVKNFDGAMKWLLKSAKMGHHLSQSTIALMYEEGKGVLEDCITAYAWHIIAVCREESYRERKERLAKKMNPEQFAKAQELSKEMVKKNGELIYPWRLEKYPKKIRDYFPPKQESAKVIEAAIRKELKKPTGELTKADLEMVTVLYLQANRLTDLTGLEKLTKLEVLHLDSNKLTDVTGLENLKQLKGLTLDKNQLTSVKGLENLTQLKDLYLVENPDLTKSQIDELQKALPDCKIIHNAKK